MKESTFYFSHDYNARNDSKIKKLICKHGFLGYGLFWAIIEDLYNNANALPTDYESIAFDLRTDEGKIESIINDFDLFVIENSYFYSYSVKSRLDKRNEKSEKAKKSALSRWNKSENDANALQPQTDGIANKGNKRKLKENKEVISIEDRKLKFSESLFNNELNLSKNILQHFFEYWTEPNQNKTKMRFELEKTWSLKGRLTTWIKNDAKFNNGKNGKLTTEEALRNF